MVGSEPPLSEWPNCTETSAISSDYIGRFPSRLGSLVPGSGDTVEGPWKPKEGHLYINCLELLAATLATKEFLKDLDNVVINLEIDNATAVAYISHLGGTHSDTVSPCQGAVGMVSGEGMPCDSNSHTRDIECRNGQAVPLSGGQERLENTS